MSKQTQQRPPTVQTAEPAPTMVAKGRMVEQIVAWLHEEPGVIVQRNARLAPVDGIGRRREIDVLVINEVAGSPNRTVIECKNERKPISVLMIDGYIGKLADVGIPVQSGIFVSASGYTKDALQRAQRAGLRVLTLGHLTQEGFTAEVRAAWQSLVYLLPVVQSIEWSWAESEAQATDQDNEIIYDPAGRTRGTLRDLVWEVWKAEPSFLIRPRGMIIEPPAGAQVKVGKQLVPLRSVTASLHVCGVLLIHTGTVQEYTLRESTSKAVDRLRLKLDFANLPATSPVTLVTTEAELRALVDEGPRIQVTGRWPLPRLRVGSIYWPPSARVAQHLQQVHALEPDADADALLSGIEGTDLRTMWDPIWEHQPEFPPYERVPDDTAESSAH